MPLSAETIAAMREADPNITDWSIARMNKSHDKQVVRNQRRRRHELVIKREIERKRQYKLDAPKRKAAAIAHRKEQAIEAKNRLEKWISYGDEAEAAYRQYMDVLKQLNSQKRAYLPMTLGYNNSCNINSPFNTTIEKWRADVIRSKQMIDSMQQRREGMLNQMKRLSNAWGGGPPDRPCDYSDHLNRYW